MENCLPEDIIKCNFFRLSLPSQIKIYEMYLNDLKNTRYYDFFKESFKKYISVVNVFNVFKSEFPNYTNDQKKDLRYIIKKCRERINPDNKIKLSSYSNECQNMADKISDAFVEQYIYDSFSYGKLKRIRIVLEFIACYSKISKYSFEEVLTLFSGNKNLFDSEIRSLDSGFYSLYLSLATVDRMKYIWCLSNRNCSLLLDDLLSDFKRDSTYVKPMRKVNIKNIDEYRKRFKMDR